MAGPLGTSGGGGGASAHTDLAGVTADQHHAQAHAVSGADHTGTITAAQHGAVGSGASHTVAQPVAVASGGTLIGTRATINLTGATVTDNAGADRVDVAIPVASYGTPGASAIGDAVGAGSATTVSRSDHVHGREAGGVPIAVTAGATGSAGSATTVARSDHAHATAGVAVLFARTTLATAAASITFGSIPAGYTHYEMRFAMRSDRASSTDNVITRLNGDSAANYRSSGVAFTYMASAIISGGTSLGLLAHYYSVPYLFAGDSTNYTASGYCLGSYSHATSYQSNTAISAYIWLNTARVTTITLSSVNGANFVSGSCAELWGVP